VEQATLLEGNEFRTLKKLDVNAICAAGMKFVRTVKTLTCFHMTTAIS
jgi:hypothetical protein